MTATYDLIASNVLTSSASSVTFSSIPATYRDLVLVVTATPNTTQIYPALRFNSDSGSNYSIVWMAGNGSSALSGSDSFNLMSMTANNNVPSNPSVFSLYVASIMDYSATDKHKSVLIRSNLSTTGTGAVAGRWANTSAINSVTITPEILSFGIGSSFYLYGIAS